MQTRTTDARLGTAPLNRLILQMGIPGLIAQTVNLLYSLVDRVFLGRIEGVGALALTGVGLCMPVIQLVSAFSAIVGAGGAPLAGIALGRGDRERAERVLGIGAMLLLTCSVVLTSGSLILKEPVLRLAGASDATLPYAEAYLTTYLCGTLFVMLTLGLNPYISAQGCPGTAMCSVLIGALLNLCLDPLFIFGLGMGVRGAALATVISQGASAVWILYFLVREKTSLRLRRDRIILRPGILKSMVSLGISPFIMNSTESLISAVLMNGLSRFGGDLYVASLTVLMSVSSLTGIPIGGFNSGVAPIISYCYGAGRFDRVRASVRRLNLISWSFSALLALSAILFPGFYGKLFTDDPELIALIRRVLPVFIAGMTVFGLQHACQTSFMALGQAKISLMIALLRKVVLLAPLAWILPRITGNVMSIYRAEPIADTLSALTCVTLFVIRIRSLLKEEPK